MDRRAFLITTGGVAVAAASGSAAEAGASADAPSPGSGATVLRLAMAWADTPQGPADSARRLGRRIAAMTQGRYRIELAPADAEDPLSQADLLHGTAHDLAPLHPAFAYFAGLPGSGGLGATDLAHWIAVGGGQMLWDDLAGRHGWKPLLAGHMGEAPPLWSRRPIGALADLAGLRLSAPGLGADVARGLGAEASTPLPAAVLLASRLADGSLDGAEAGGALASLAQGVAQDAPHATGTGFNAAGTALALHIRLAVWNRLSDADKAIFAAAAAEELQASMAEARAHERIARDVLSASFGVQFAPWPGDVADALERVAEATIAHVAGHDATAARIDQSYMAFRNAVSGSALPRRATAMS